MKYYIFEISISAYEKQSNESEKKIDRIIVRKKNRKWCTAQCFSFFAVVLRWSENEISKMGLANINYNHIYCWSNFTVLCYYSYFKYIPHFKIGWNKSTNYSSIHWWKFWKTFTAKILNDNFFFLTQFKFGSYSNHIIEVALFSDIKNYSFKLCEFSSNSCYYFNVFEANSYIS